MTFSYTTQPEDSFRAKVVEAETGFINGLVHRYEVFRCEIDELLEEDTGPVRYELNRDYVDGLM